MGTRGRKSRFELMSEGHAAGVAGVHLAPPADANLSAEERVVWVRTVESKPVSWFGQEHVPLLVGYVRHVVETARLQRELKGMDPATNVRKYVLYTRLVDVAIRTLLSYARSMRLTQQSQLKAKAAGALHRRHANEHDANATRPWTT